MTRCGGNVKRRLCVCARVHAQICVPAKMQASLDKYEYTYTRSVFTFVFVEERT